MASPTNPDTSQLRCWAEIDLSNLRHNADFLRKEAGDRCGIMAIVKADAYGHGLEHVVSCLMGHVDWFGVANYQEAKRAFKAAGSQSPSILILSPPTPAEINPIIESGLSASVSSIEEVTAFGEAAARLGTQARLHAVADTGMGRMGSLPDHFGELVATIKDHPNCELEGLETHFPSADDDPDFTRAQIASFSSIIRALAPENACHLHIANSAGLLGFQRNLSFATLARPGIALYGISPLEDHAPLRPVMSLKTRITLVRNIPTGTSISYGRTFISDKPMTVATLGVGYGDGYTRYLTGEETHVLIAGTRCPLLGRVTMDQIVVDISHLDEPVACGDVATLIGEQGDESITAKELATRAGTIPWEILTGITSRVERVYVASATEA